MPKTRGAWIALAGFLCVVLALFTWLVFVSPKLTEESDLAEQEKALASENDTLEAKVAALRAQFARIDEFKAALAQLQTRIPTDAELEGLLDEVSDLADDRDVIINGATADKAQSLSGETVTPPAAPTPTPSPSADPAAPAAPVPAAAPGWTASGPADLVALPFKIDVDADYDDLVAFLGDLQTKSGRYALVTSPSITAHDSSSPDAKRELNAVFSLFVFVLTDEAATAAEEPAEAPAPASSRENKFAAPE